MAFACVRDEKNMGESKERDEGAGREYSRVPGARVARVVTALFSSSR
jgi:hypothetical protein